MWNITHPETGRFLDQILTGFFPVMCTRDIAADWEQHWKDRPQHVDFQVRLFAPWNTLFKVDRSKKTTS